MALVRYQRNQAALDQQAKEDQDNAFNGNVFAQTFKNGTTVIRVMPQWSDKGVWFQKITEHFINSKKRSFTCTAELFGRCPVCEYGDALSAAGQPEVAKNFRASDKYLVNAVYLSEPSGKFGIKDGIKVFKIPASVRQTLLNYDRDTDGAGWNDITNYEHGVNFKIERTGANLQTKYTVMPLAQRTDIVKRFSEEGINPEGLTLYALDTLFLPESLEGAFDDFNALMSDAPTAEPQVVNAGIPATGSASVAPAASAVPVPSGFAPAAAPRLSVTVAPPPLPKRG
jgi:hypothetical protein